MLLKLIINLILLFIDFILLIQLMLARKGRGPRPKRPRTDAWRAEDRGPKGRGSRHGPVGRGITGNRAASPLATSYSPGECCKLRIGNWGGAPRQPDCFPTPKATLNCINKCHHVWSSSLSGTVYCYSGAPLEMSYGRNDQRIISTCDDSTNTCVSHSTVPQLGLCRN